MRLNLVFYGEDKTVIYETSHSRKKIVETSEQNPAFLLCCVLGHNKIKGKHNYQLVINMFVYSFVRRA